MGATIEQLEQRVRTLETWANREALRRGSLGFLVERMVAEQLAAMTPEEAERILSDLSNPYRFNLRVRATKPSSAKSGKRPAATSRRWSTGSESGSPNCAPSGRSLRLAGRRIDR